MLAVLTNLGLLPSRRQEPDELCLFFFPYFNVILYFLFSYIFHTMKMTVCNKVWYKF